MSKPLFKRKVKVEPEERQDPVQRAKSAVLWVMGRLSIPLFGGADAEEPAEEGAPELECLMPYLMNCTRWRDLAARRPCPRACPYVAWLKPFACTFTCVNASQCHYADAGMPFANPATGLCEDSGIDGCEVASGNGTRCDRCRAHFTMAGDQASCTYEREGSLIWGVEQLRALGSWGLALLALAALGMGWRLRQSLVRHWDLLTFARIHHHLCKVRKSPKVHAGSPLYSLFENLHTKFIVGVGLPLYYNSLVFLALVSVVLFLGAHAALTSSESSLFSYAGGAAAPARLFGVPLYPSTAGVGDASICGWAMAKGAASPGMVDVVTTSRAFMRRLAGVVLALYCAVLAVVLLHARCQLRHAAWFEARHLTMKDFALGFAGLPPGATDELHLACFLSSQLGAEVRAVSVGYDLGGREAEVQALVDRHLAYADAEVRGGCPAGVGLPPLTRARGAGARARAAVGPEALRRERDSDRERVRAWFAAGAAAPMRGTGCAWAVFARAEDRDCALQLLDARGGALLWWDPATGREHSLRASVPRCEPTNIRWGNLRIGTCARCLRFALASCFFLGVCAAMAVLLYWPYAAYVTSYLDEAGKFPQGFMMGLLGVLIGLSWWLMCVVIGSCVGYIGLHTAENEYIFIFITFTHFCVLASAFNVYLTWYYTQQVWEDPNKPLLHRFSNHWMEGPVSTLRDLRREIDLGFRVFQLLVPGVLFTPCLLNPLNNFVVPYFRESALLVLFGQGKSGREAERYLEPLPLGLPWDYQGHATLPFCCCLTFFVMSPSMWWTHAYLCAWCLFFYFFQRFMHLRVCKKTFCTATKLDRIVLYVGWGLLLAELAACHAYWKLRLREWPPAAMPLAVLASYATYWLLLRCLVGVRWPMRLHSCCPAPLARRGAGVAVESAYRACEDFCYDWLNVNPVHVLKSQYCPDLLGGAEPVVFYEPGKEYLQLLAGAGAPRAGDDPRWSMTNHGLWLELEGLGCVSPPLPPQGRPVAAAPAPAGPAARTPPGSPREAAARHPASTPSGHYSALPAGPAEEGARHGSPSAAEVCVRGPAPTLAPL